MAAYVERDGDWVLRPPGKLESVSMWIFVLRAGEPELTALCTKFIDGPTGGTVKATTLFPGVPFVLLVCADIARGYSTDAADNALGWMTERDVGFFVPVTLQWNNQAGTSNLLPYLFVDNFPAVLIGREIFGFPKVLAQIQAAGDASPMNPLQKPPAMRFTVKSKVLPTGSPDGAVVDDKVIDIRSTTRRLPVILPGLLGAALPLIAQEVLTALGVPAPGAMNFAQIPMTFLKEFRGAANRTDACHKSVVKADASIDALYGGAILRDDYKLKLPRHDSIHIADTLGLGPGEEFKPVAAVSVKIDFSLPFGKVLWTAP